VSHVRIAHPTLDLAAIAAFYGALLGLSEVVSFEDHDGFSGCVYTLPGSQLQVEFTRGPEARLPEWSGETLLVFYVPEKDAYERILAGLERANVSRVTSTNPYWERTGATFLDPDGRRVVIQNTTRP